MERTAVIALPDWAVELLRDVVAERVEKLTSLSVLADGQSKAVQAAVRSLADYVTSGSIRAEQSIAEALRSMEIVQTILNAADFDEPYDTYRSVRIVTDAQPVDAIAADDDDTWDEPLICTD